MRNRLVLTLALVAVASLFTPLYAQEAAAAADGGVRMWSVITAGFALAFAAGLGALAQARGLSSAAEGIARNAALMRPSRRGAAGGRRSVTCRLQNTTETPGRARRPADDRGRDTQERVPPSRSRHQAAGACFAYPTNGLAKNRISATSST